MTIAETSIATDGRAAGIELDSDNGLIRRYLNGDPRAFEVLFKKYQRPIFNLVSRMVNGEDAYDLTQDVFCNALRGLHNFRGESKFSTWLYSIARNVCLNRLRQTSYSGEESLDEIEERSEMPDPSIDIHRTAETHEVQRLVNSVLATLTPEQRLLITLRDFEGLSYEEISQVTGVTLTNVKSRLHRARMVFKDRFKPWLSIIHGGGG